MINDVEQKAKLKTLNVGAKVKVKLSDYQLYKLAYNKGPVERPTEEIKQEIINNHVDKDGYLTISLWELAHYAGKSMPEEILINADDLQEQQTKSTEPERER